MGTSRQQDIAAQRKDALAEQRSAYDNYRRSGATDRIVAADRRVARLQGDMYDAATGLIDPKFTE